MHGQELDGKRLKVLEVGARVPQRTAVVGWSIVAADPEHSGSGISDVAEPEQPRGSDSAVRGRLTHLDQGHKIAS